MAYNFLIIGGDKRLKFLAEKLKDTKNYKIGLLKVPSHANGIFSSLFLSVFSEK